MATVVFPDRMDDIPVTMVSGEIVVDRNDTLVCFDTGKEIVACGISYEQNARGKGSTGSMNIPGKPQDRYFGAGYVDYPPIGELEYSTDGMTWNKAADLLPVENTIGHKSRRRTISFPAVKGRYFRLNIHDWSGGDTRYPALKLKDVTLYPYDIVDNYETMTALRTEVTYPSVRGGNRGVISHNDVIDVSGLMTPDGNLTLTLPRGEWRILRFGYQPTGAKTKHGRKNLHGYEADVMSAEAASVHYNNYFKAVCDTLAAIGCRPAGMVMDSHEAGTQNWTCGFENIFETINGYDLICRLPVLTGRIVDSREVTDRILNDFRRAIASTISSEFYGTFTDCCHRDSVYYTSQAMLNIANDNIASRGNADRPQGEFWAYQTDGNYDCLDAASSAHLYGHPIASGEAFTDTPYSATWDELLRIANIAYCRGLNEFVVCASSYQPWLDRKYDDSQSAHPYIFHRHNPAWSTVKPFWDYQARCADLLRKGQPVVDLCVYVGEEPPVKTFAYKLPIIPEGYNFDVCSRDALINRMSALDGHIAVDGGMTYRAILVQDRTYISPEVFEKLRSLSQQGVPVVWCNYGENVAEALPRYGIRPDATIDSTGEPDDRVMFFHCQADDCDIYFVYNHSAKSYDKPMTLRTDYCNAELWSPKKVTRSEVELTGNKTLHLSLEPWEATFIIVR